MVNYANGKIYKIECLTTGLIYVGSTTKERLSQRLVQHRQDFKRYQKNTYNFISSFTILENNNYRIELLEEVNCNTKDQLHMREGHYIKTIECVNKFVPGRTDKEYYQDNKETKKEYAKQYRETKKEKINERQNVKHICDCGGKYNFSYKQRHLKTPKHQNFVNSQI